MNDRIARSPQEHENGFGHYRHGPKHVNKHGHKPRRGHKYGLEFKNGHVREHGPKYDSKHGYGSNHSQQKQRGLNRKPCIGLYCHPARMRKETKTRGQKT